MLDLSAPGVDENKVVEELSKQLSAFANSDGGVLVCGVTNPLDHKPRQVDDGGITIAMKRPNTREWLEDIIPGLVEFPLKRFNVYTLTKTAGAPQLPDDRCIILVDIPASDDAPHQARDQRYYTRVGGKSRPIGHRLVSDIFHRRSHPKLSFKVKIVETIDTKLKVFVNVRNHGKVVPQNYATIIFIPRIIKALLRGDKLLGQQIGGANYYRLTVVGEKPVFPESDEYSEVTLDYNIGTPPAEPVSDKMFCTIYADEMPAIKREVSVSAALANWV
jgi:predicted HTH transcriptional regulator